MSMVHPMRSACVEYICIPTENQMPPQFGQNDLFQVLEVKLGHTDLIRISSLMWWNMEIKYTSNYSVGVGLQEYIRNKSCKPT